MLIVLPQNPRTDSITSALVLKKLFANKHIDIASVNFDIPQELDFLSDLKQIKSDIPALQKCVIEINTANNPLSDLRYEKKADKLTIILTPRQGDFPSQAILIKDKQPLYDLILTINATEPESLGNLYFQHRDFFNNTPIINISHKADCEYFAQINWIDINATSVCEMLYANFFYNQKPDASMCTALLAGIMDETHTFRTHTVQPRTLHYVSELMLGGADYQLIVTKLYRTKTVGLLKLWGFVLDRLQVDRELYLTWCVVPAGIFQLTGTKIEQLNNLHQEILSHTPQAKTVVMIVQDPKNLSRTEIQVSAAPPVNAKDLILNLQPIGSERSALAEIKEGDLFEIENNVIDNVKKKLRIISV